MRKYEERFYRWLGWALTGAAMVIVVTNYPTAAFPLAILGFACGVMARLIRLERRVEAFEAMPKKLDDTLEEFRNRITP